MGEVYKTMTQNYTENIQKNNDNAQNYKETLAYTKGQVWAYKQKKYTK